MTAKELAKELGISAATLSLVLNGKPGISDKTRANVLDKLKEMGYTNLIKHDPNALPNKTLGFVIFKNSGKILGEHAFYPEVLDSVETAARKCGYNLNIITIERKEAEKQIQYILDANCIGYIIFATEMEGDEIQNFQDLGLPFVLLDNYYNDKDINSVTVNNEQCTYLAVQYLISQGHRNIGYLRSGLSFRSFQEREMWSDIALQHFGINDMRNYTYTVGYPIDSACQGILKATEQLKAPDAPTAFLADNDLVAIGAMRGMQQLGYAIPEDFSFIGIADRPISSLIEPKLTTIRVPKERFGAEAVSQLVQQLDQPCTSYVKVAVNGELVIRDSVKSLI